MRCFSELLSSSSLGPLNALALLAIVGTLPGCSFGGSGHRVPTIPDVQTSVAPFKEVHTDWKQRMETPYVYLEIFGGSYAEAGSFLPSLMDHCRAQGITPAGPPFGLFYDDPLRVPAAELRARLCLPVRQLEAVADPLGFDLLPAAEVAYARVAGPYPEVPNSYPGLFDYLRERGWVLVPPIRETYLVDPGRVQSFDQLITEVQMPWRRL